MDRLFRAGIIAIFVGLILVIAGLWGGDVSTGGVIFIGPFPFVFGSGPQGAATSLVSVVVGGVMVVLLFLWGIRASKGRDP